MKKRTVIIAASLACAVVAVLGVVIGSLAGGEDRGAPAQPTQTTAATQATVAVRPREETDIWISLPDESDPHWAKAGADLKMLLENLQYPVTLTYARGDALEQADQMVYAIEQGADCLVIAAVDSTALYEAAQLAQQAQIPVVAYDRLLMDTQAVTYYVAYDYKAMGASIAKTIVTAKDLTATQPQPCCTVEFFMGSPESSNALLLYQGIMEVLQPYLDSGVLVSRSGRTAFEDTCVVGWDPEGAGSALTSYLTEYYPEDVPDILCTVSDSFADACIRVLEATGCTPENWPVITGLGDTETGRDHMAQGKQTATVITDLMELNERCVQLVDDMLTGKTPELNDTETCYNNVRVVPAYLCDFQTIMSAGGAGQHEETSEDTEDTADISPSSATEDTTAAPQAT